MINDASIDKFMTKEQKEYLDKNDLWTAFDEVSASWDDDMIGDNWEDYWELFVGFIEG